MESDADLVRDSLKMVVQLLIEADVSHQIGAKKYERTPERVTQRNGHRDRMWETRAGDIVLDIPKLREGTYYPDWLLEPRRPAEKALVNVIQQAYIAGVSTRKMEGVMEELGLSGLDKSKVSRITKELNDQVEAFRNCPLHTRCAYVWPDALHPKVRQNHPIVSQALVIAVGVDDTGHREAVLRRRCHAAIPREANALRSPLNRLRNPLPNIATPWLAENTGRRREERSASRTMKKLLTRARPGHLSSGKGRAVLFQAIRRTTQGAVADHPCFSLAR